MANTLYSGEYCRHHDESQFGGIKLSTKPEGVNAIIRGLTAAGVKENKIVVCDRLIYHLIKAGFPQNQGSSGVRCYGTEPMAGYDKKIYYESLGDEYSLRQDDGAQSLFSTIVTQHVTAINNTPRFHPSSYFCDPAPAEVFALPILRDKVRFHIVNALQPCFEGGTASMKAWTMWNEERLFLGLTR